MGTLTPNGKPEFTIRSWDGVWRAFRPGIEITSIIHPSKMFFLHGCSRVEPAPRRKKARKKSEKCLQPPVAAVRLGLFG